MYAFIQESEHVVWKNQWCTLTSGVSLQVDIYMTQEDRVFVVDVVVTNPTQKTMALSVIS
jgi:hypothetical protein